MDSKQETAYPHSRRKKLREELEREAKADYRSLSNYAVPKQLRHGGYIRRATRTGRVLTKVPKSFFKSDRCS
ncbi:hypothetical protein [Thermoflavimicrobium dichotomicum]|uniref:hypothetical protein n=1 Tax=Thermoflavimicrobium dichotomicum TaxID=46223 RepID=UPI001113D16E|nr:hypothetical protein [Thermoflavimicrobium dichotomicum]